MLNTSVNYGSRRWYPPPSCVFLCVILCPSPQSVGLTILGEPIFPFLDPSKAPQAGMALDSGTGGENQVSPCMTCTHPGQDRAGGRGRLSHLWSELIEGVIELLHLGVLHFDEMNA
jgi:hypothetical protein